MKQRTIAPFADERDEDHPIEWVSAGGDKIKQYVTWPEAIRRLGNYGYAEGTVRSALTRGEMLRTDFAFYRLLGIPVQAEPGSLADRLLA